MRSLEKKLLRNLWEMKAQALAIAIVIVSGVATFILSVSTMESLKRTQARFYADYRFADVFASLKRAPDGLAARIAEIPGVDRVETRVVAEVKLEIPDYDEPVTGRLVSVPDIGEPELNQLYLTEGRMVEPGRDDEVVLGEAFAEAHGIRPGFTFTAVINGRLKELAVVGVALSPEYVYQLKPGTIFPDFERYAVMWMARTPLGTAYDMDGAFNDVALSVNHAAAVESVIDRLDVLLEPYGGTGAYGRIDQVSHRYLSEEFKQLANMATVFPVIFLGVAAFLLNIVVTRLVDTQREQIAVLKAFGYTNRDIGLHYAALVLAITLIGVTGGIGVGMRLGKGLSNMYMDYYRFPFIDYGLDASTAFEGALISIAAAMAGALFAVRKAAILPPAVAMRPAPPAVYRVSLVERAGLGRLLSPQARMITRNIERTPVKSMLTVIGIAFACAVLVAGMFFRDAVDYIVEVQFGLAQRDDLAVSFVEPTSWEALYSLQGLQGVERVEPFRSVPATLRFGHRSYRTSIMGIQNGGDLYQLLDTQFRQVDLPSRGVVLTDYLAEILGISPGDTLTVEVLEGERPVRQVAVAGLVNEFIGVSAYMEISALNRLMREGHAISGAYLSTDSAYDSRIYRELHEMPRVAGTTVRKLAIESFYETMSGQVLIFTTIMTALAMSIAFGVVYNSARISLSERSRDLGSLRVLGFTRGEVSFILLGELAALTLASIPIGFGLGRLMATYMLVGMESDLFRLPVIIGANTYAFAAAVVLVAAVASGIVVKMRLDRLALVEILKTKE
ncbi:MAG: FtsX-like permease family protein [Candidatus Abyssobacteria bacterium SURF_5]|uniref:FtsX-like permease family protein n=1 Tax=Abyssobacteria bacterium (strain SURF_5) TaxID=2093360 RepID=A0A3A4NAV1_ABYX5|nr:MAG: FtsX-like permease family protein [Candidatus Abyssubacteria bacterium SURF_5]